MTALQLFGCWRSSASHRLQIGLRLKQLSFTYTPVSLDQGEQHSDWYLALNPRAEVPTLLVDGEPWVQTLAILETLEETLSGQGNPLLPSCTRERRICRSIAEQVNSSLQPLLLPARLRRPILKAGEDNATLASALQAGVRDHQHHALASLNAWLDALPGPYCIGAHPTLADVCVVPQLEAAMRLRLDLTPFRRLNELHRACLALEAFAAAAPEQQPDAPERSDSGTVSLADRNRTGLQSGIAER